MRRLRSRNPHGADRPVFGVAYRRREAADACGALADRRAGSIRLDGYSDTDCYPFAHRYCRAGRDSDRVTFCHSDAIPNSHSVTITDRYGHTVSDSHTVSLANRYGHAVSDPHAVAIANRHRHADRSRDRRRTHRRGH